METSKNSARKLIFWAIVIGVIFAAVAFVYSAKFSSKSSEVTGKIVVVPSGTSATAVQNLYLEAGNTVEMINSPSFKRSVFGDKEVNFGGAKVVANSSTVAVVFSADEGSVKLVEDKIVALPGKISDYAREIYGGTPFKYLLISDPEVVSISNSANAGTNAIWGFFVGAVLYLIVWLVAGSVKIPSWEEKMETAEQEAEQPIFSPEIKQEKPKTLEMKVPPMPEIPKQEIQMDSEPIITARDLKNVAPDNLPIAEAEEKGMPEFHEPSDDEVKERLNKLMRGEL